MGRGLNVARRVGCVVLAIASFAARPAAAVGECGDLFGSGFESPAALAAPITGSATLTTSDGATHTFYYRIPTTPAPFHGHPALLWLHGDGGSGNGYGAAFYPFTDVDSAIVVTPSGSNLTWEHAAGDRPNRPQDSQFISLLIDALITQGIAGERVDARRIYLGGESRGAYMPYFLLQRPSTKSRFAAVAVNAGLLYCQSGDMFCQSSTFDPNLHDAPTPILHLHGTNDTAVAPPPTSSFHAPIDWNIDWRVFSPMKFWARQNGCFDGGNAGGLDDGVLQETYSVGGRVAQRYDLSAHGPACAKYQLTLVTDGGHVIAGQQSRIWSFLRGYCHAPGT